MPTVFAKDAGDHACPYRDFTPCLGPKCMAWSWSGAPFQRCETDNLVHTEEGPRPIGAPPAPEGDGWQMDGAPSPKGYHRSAKDKLPLATSQRWILKHERLEGECARHHGDHQGGYW